MNNSININCVYEHIYVNNFVCIKEIIYICLLLYNKIDYEKTIDSIHDDSFASCVLVHTGRR